MGSKPNWSRESGERVLEFQTNGLKSSKQPNVKSSFPSHRGRIDIQLVLKFMLRFKKFRITPLLSIVRDFGGNQRANVAMIFAFILIPVLFAAGMGIDYAMAARRRAKLDAAADSAALAALTPAMMALDIGTWKSTAQSVATNMFNSLAGQVSGLGSTPTPVVTICPTSATPNNCPANVTSRTVTVSYSGKSVTNFSGIIGQTTMNIGGNATATFSTPPYVNIYVLLDISSSMGIGATTSDQQLVYNATTRTGNPCGLACHYDTTESLAHQYGATLRIDVAKTALTQALNQLQTNQGYVQVAIYTFSNKFANVFPLSSNLSGAITAVSGIDLSSQNNDGGTNLTYGLKQLYSTALQGKTPGNGQTQATAQSVVMLITDGVQDSDMKYLSFGSYADGYDSNFPKSSSCSSSQTSTCWYDSTFGIYLEPFDPSQCAPIKAANFSMMTLDVQYLVPPSNLQSQTQSLNDVFTYIQKYLLSSIQTNMTSCATSSAYAYSANTPAEITTAVANMFTAATNMAHLTQ
jgi:Flp pilus assembly protein TadG